MNIISWLLFFSVLCPVNQYDPLDKELVDTFIHSEERNPYPQYCLMRAALSLQNKPYVAATLEGNEEEQLIVNLRELDCTTLVENCLALSLTVNRDSLPSFNGFTKYLQEIRYRKGKLDGYPSRLHYFTDWILDNTQQGFVEDITCELGGKPYTPNVYYMSVNPDKYAALNSRPEYIPQIKEAETRINKADNFCYIPNKHIDIVSEDIKDGDIVAFVTSLKGLDIQHVGIAYWNEGELSFIHASSRAGKVIINPESIRDYCHKQKSILGIMVLRMV